MLCFLIYTDIPYTTKAICISHFWAYISLVRIIDWHSSESAWIRVIKRYPDDHYAYFMRGDYWAVNGQFDKAKSDYNQCIRRNGRAYMAINNAGLIYLEENSLMLALDEFSRAININENFFKAYLNRGLTYMRIGKYNMALENMTKAISLNPAEPLAYYNRGLIYERQNALQAAIPDFTKAIQLDPYRTIYYKDRGKAYVWMQRFDLAEIDYSKAISLDPENAEMWFRRSLVRVSQDNFTKGLEDALMAKKLGFEVEEEYLKGLTVEVLKKDLPPPE